MRVALVANIPAPYRVPVYDGLARRLGGALRVIYMAERESNRSWATPSLAHDHVYLRGFAVTVGGRDIHVRRGMWRALRDFAPDVVMTGGFNPPMLAAWLYAQRYRLRHVAVSDDWAGSESHLTHVHRAARRAVYRTSAAFVGASAKTLELFASLGARGPMHVAPLCVDNAVFARAARSANQRDIDLLFVGALIERKMPLFFAEVVRHVMRRRLGTRVVIAGDGELRPALERALAATSSAVEFRGALQPAELPALYGRARVLCFPTQRDAWGVVANEAYAAGTPVLTTNRAGCAGELVHDGVLPADPALWADRACELLDDDGRWNQASKGAFIAVAAYNFDRAIDAFMAACE